MFYMLRLFFLAVFVLLFDIPPPFVYAHHCPGEPPRPEYPRHSCHTRTQTQQPGEPTTQHPGGSPGRGPGPAQEQKYVYGQPDPAFVFADGFSRGLAECFERDLVQDLLTAPLARVKQLERFSKAIQFVGTAGKIVSLIQALREVNPHADDYELGKQAARLVCDGKDLRHVVAHMAPGGTQWPSGRQGGLNPGVRKANKPTQAEETAAELSPVLGAIIRQKAGFSEKGLPIILDENVMQKGLAEGLRKLGYNVRDIREIFGTVGVKDADIIKVAEAIGARVLTNNVKDFGRNLAIPLPRTGGWTPEGIEQFIKYYTK